MANKLNENIIAFYLGLWVGKLTKVGLKLLNKTVPYFPGAVAGKINPNIKCYLNKPKTIIAVTGTNGKSTTCKMLQDFLVSQGLKVINNNGFNTSPGIIACLMDSVTIFNHQKYDVAILETDELTSKKIFKDLKIDYMIITNLFRDSIEKNGSPEFMASKIKDALQENTRLIINADDPLVTTLANDNTTFYGISNLKTDYKVPYNILSDMVLCPKCHNPIKYSHIKYSHIGKFKCSCGHSRPECKYEISEINFDEKYFIMNSKRFDLSYNNLPNTYNALGSISLLLEMGYKEKTINEEFKKIKILGTRYVVEENDGKILMSTLAKGQNPVAVSQTFEMINRDENLKDVVLLMDDVMAKRQRMPEVEEWLYDSDFEFLNDKKINKIIVGGVRSKDFLVRLLLAGIKEDKIITTIDEEKVSEYISYDKVKEIIIVHDVFNNDLVSGVKADIRKRWYK